MIKRYIDIETYSSVDLKERGLKNYIEDPSFEINLIGWVDEDMDRPFSNMEEVENAFKQVSEPKERDLNFFRDGFEDPCIIHVAHNINFEIAAFEKVLDITIDLDRVVCTMTRCYQTGLPGSLDKVSKALNLKYAKTPGTALINYFAKPCKPTKANEGRIRNMPYMNSVKWQEYKDYNKFDVLAMIELDKKILSWFPQPSIETELWKLDHKLNNRGVNIDLDLVENAVSYVLTHQHQTMLKLQDITGLSNANSVAQLTAWLVTKCPDIAITSIAKEPLNLIKESTKEESVKEAITCRQLLSKTSCKKYIALEKLIHKENTLFCTSYRLYNLLQFSATNTGRWAGRGFQVHNLPKNKLGYKIHQLREAYKKKKRVITDELPFELSQLLRTVIIPDAFKVMLVCDYSAIEARIAAWVAREEWVLEVFRGDGKIYEAMAAKMFGKNIEAVTKEERADGKVAVLAGGYGGGCKAFQHFAPEWTDTKAQIMVDYFRDSNPKIVKTWGRVENAARYTIETGIPTKVNGLINFKMRKGCLLIGLPSGRNLTYVRASVDTKVLTSPNKNDKKYYYKNIVFEQTNPLSKIWGKSETFGGRLFENIVQAIARDILAYALLTLDQKGHDILFHVHDEVITQIDDDKDIQLELEVLKSRMCKLPDWAIDLPIKAEGFSCPYYMKEEEN